MSPKARAKKKTKKTKTKTKKVKKTKKTKAKKVKKMKKTKAKKAKKAAVKAKVKVAKKKALGKVVHYYDKINVAIITLKSPLKIGDLVCLKRGELEVVQEVSSLQINHQNVARAGKGAVVGMKVDVPVKEGAVVLAA
ncbi:MAG: hypothetical protein WC840_04760 [Candidatus Peribacteraceae bacterium]